MNTEQLKQAALDVQQNYPLAYDRFERLAKPSTILALLECVGALKDMLSEVEDGIATSPLTRVTARAALQKLEAL